jgi:alpha-tubulin suppressor-like RCC1 family protein
MNEDQVRWSMVRAGGTAARWIRAVCCAMLIAAGAVGIEATAVVADPGIGTGQAGAIPQVDAGGSHTCALSGSGQVTCWGSNVYGQLGNGTSGPGTSTTTPGDPIALPNNTTATAISAGEFHTCALLNTGGVSCWGINTNASLGNGTSGPGTDTNVPGVPITLPDDASGNPTTATAISAGNYHTCAILNTGAVTCWGYNYTGQVGNGSNDNVSTPVGPIALPGGSTATAIAAGGEHTCAILNTGAVSCWGGNRSGELGSGTFGTATDTNTPGAPISLLDDANGNPATAIAITAGIAHTCVVVNTGGVTCWGLGSNGQLGNSTNVDASAPATPIALPNDANGKPATASAISAGTLHSCALLNTGGISCWGYNGGGQLGSGTTVSSNAPGVTVTLPNDANGNPTTAVAVTADNFHTCALLNTGAVTCWGENFMGQVGTNSNGANVTSPIAPVALPGGMAVTAVAAGLHHSCSLLSTGDVSCWGLNDFGQLGNNSLANSSVPVGPIELPDGATATAIAAGFYHMCAVLNTGGVSCWGRNTSGQLGNNSFVGSSVPVGPIGLPGEATATSIAAGVFHSCAVLNTGGVSCWGAPRGLGIDSSSGRPSPVGPIGLPGGATATAIAAGSEHGCALLNTGGVSCWGYNVFGQLGNNDTWDSLVPVGPIGLPGGATATAIGGGYWFSCALLNTGGVSCWGRNDFGQLGNNSSAARSLVPVGPIGLPGGATATAIGIGGEHGCAVLNTGDVSCWGRNSEGQLGDATTTLSRVPVMTGVLPAPTASAVGGDGAAGVSWVPTVTSGVFGDVSGWLVEYSTDGTNWTSVAVDDPAATDTTITGLTNFVAHQFRVSAVNPAGVGPVSTAVSATPNSPPFATITHGTIAAPGVSPTNQSPITFSISFDQSVTGLEISDFVASNASLGNLTGSGASYTIDATPTGEGDVGIELPENTVVNQYQQPNAPSAGPTVTFDGTAPIPTITTTQTTPTNATVIAYVLETPDAPGGYAPTVDLGGTADGSVEVVAGVLPDTWDVTVTVTSDGTITPSIPAGDYTDLAGNSNVAAAGPTITVDTAAPAPAFATSEPALTNATVIAYVLETPEAPGGYAPSVDLGGTATGSVEVVAGVLPNTWDVTVTVTTDGTVRPSISAGDYTDRGGNPSVAVVGPTIAIDTAAPVPGFATSEPALTNSTTVVYVLDTPDAPEGYTPTVDVDGPSTATAEVVPGDEPDTWDVTVTVTSDGTVTPSIPAGDYADLAGNPNAVAAGSTIEIDTTGPTIDGPAAGSTVRVNTDPGRPYATVTFNVTATDPASSEPANNQGVNRIRNDRQMVPAETTEVEPTCAPVSGSQFPIGSTEVTCTATDAVDNATTLRFQVEVTDNEAPVISSTPNISATIPPGAGTVVVSYPPPTATDNSGASIIVTCNPPPGASHAVGTKTLTCSAVDPAGNTASSTFQLIVVASPPPVGELPSTGNNANRTTRYAGYIMLAGLAAVLLKGRRRTT